ncbi:hypothetical protein C8R46DRAFT_420726 [Mycena filopes]|nr:hypothetical protein C8R46DRAFT_420726 [Mycena filopes]
MSLKSQVRQRIEECRGNIARLDSQIRDLERLRERDRSTMAALQVASAPIADLPCELLMEIFLYYLTVEPSILGPVEVSFRRMLTLTQVCAYWRKIAHTTPLLWVQKRFPLTLDGAKHLTFSREATKVFLERSAPLPINVYMSPPPGLNWFPFLEDLFGAADRWRTFDLSLGTLAPLATIPAGTLKLLESAKLTSDGTHDFGPKINAFLTAPLLHTVELHVQNPEWFPMPWSQLTCLTMTSIPQTCMTTLSLCLKLRSATLYTQSLPPSVLWSATTLDTVALPQLEELNIWLTLSSEGEHFKPFLRSFDLPRLRTFGMHLYDEDAPLCEWSSAAFHQFQTRSPHIESLALDECKVGTEDLRALLLRAVDLKELRLTGSVHCVDNDLLRILHYRQPDSARVPKLERLTLQYITPVFDEETLEEVMGSRHTSVHTPGVARLKYLQYSDLADKIFTRRFLNEMARYRLEGLEVKGRFRAEDGQNETNW